MNRAWAALARRWPRPVQPARWVVLDVESSGLDPRRDHLLAIAAVAVCSEAGQLRLRPADSFEVLLQQPATAAPANKANILLHGIGVGAQRNAQPAAAALREFVRFIGDAPLLAFHAAFDRALIERRLRAVLDHRLPNLWLDLAELAPALHPQLRAHALDDWLLHFDITVVQRHQAASDTWATAELLQRLLPLAHAQGCGTDFRSLSRLAASRRWLAP